MAENVVEIVVRSKNMTKAGNDAAVADTEKSANRMADIWDKFGKDAASSLGSVAKGAGLLAGGSGLLAMAAPLGAAGLAMGAFGAVAIPTLKSTLDASTKNSQAQKSYSDSIAKAKQTYDQQMAVAEKALSQAKTAQQRQAALNQEHAAAAQLAKAEAGANLTLSQNTTKLSGSQQQLISSVDRLKENFGNLQKQMAPVVVQVATLGVKIASDLMPAFRTLATAGGTALEGLLKPLDTLFKSKLFDQFTASMSQVAKTIGPLVGTTLAGLLKVLMQLFIQVMPSGVKILQQLLPAIVAMFQEMVPVVTVMAKVVATTIQWLAQNKLLVPALWGLVTVIAAVKLGLATNPIGLVITALALLTIGVITAWKQFSAFRDILKDIAKVMLSTGIIIVQVNKQVVNAILTVIGTILHGLKDAFGWIPGGVGNALKAASAAFDRFHSGVNNTLNGVIAKMRSWQGELDASKNKANTVTQIISGDFGKQLIATNKSQAGVNALAGAIGRLKGKTVNVGVHASGSGGMTFTEKVAASISSGGFSLRSLMAAGGAVTGGTPGKDSVPILAMPGEVVVPTNMVAAGAVDHLRGKLPGFAAGGRVGSISGMPDWVGSAESGFAQSVENHLLKAEFAHLKSVVAAHAKAAAAAAASAGTHVPNVGSGVQRWKGLVDQALRMLHLSTAFDSRVLYQMMTESGGNPNAINLWDSNAKAGHPSKGLMQVIGPTFARYHVAGTSGNIYDPLANIAAAINYALHTYGPQLGNQYGGIGSGHGYASGGITGGGWAMVGEHGRELVKLPPGSHVYSNADSMSMGGGGGVLRLEISGGQSDFDRFMLQWFRNNVRVKGGGSVQKAFGIGGA